MTSSEYQYRLEEGSKKYTCPECNRRTFVRYVDYETGEYLQDHYGRCDREINCNYHLNPYKDGFGKYEKEFKRNQFSGCWNKTKSVLNSLKNPKQEFVYIPSEIFKKTIIQNGYEKNVFIQNLLSRVAFPFAPKDIEKVIAQYFLGTVCNGYRTGAITFPYIDILGSIRVVQVKQFDQDNHTIGTDFLHSIIEKFYLRKNEVIPAWLRDYKKNENKVSCLFGEHLLSRYLHNPIALVEAPKTAIYGTLYFGFPDNPFNLLWLGVYNLSSLNIEKCKVLKGRDVYLFPDLSKEGKAFELWTNKAKEIRQSVPGIRIQISDLLEINGVETERIKGFDLADYLIKLDWRKFRTVTKESEPKQILDLENIEIAKPELIPNSKSEKSEKCETFKTTFFSDSIPAYIDREGKLFIKTTLGNTFTIYPSIDHYNRRLCIPIFQDRHQIDKTSFEEVWIDPYSLTIKI